jgi:hypothetical protein
MLLLKLLNRLFHGPSWLKFLAMGVAAGGLALSSFNLLLLFQANLSLIANPMARWPRSRAESSSFSN